VATGSALSQLLPIGKRTAIMGVLNVTPDSFYDGGRYFDREAALRRAEQMVEEGADILDIGGESTRPGAEAVGLDEELRRVIPVIEEVKKRLPVPVSIDTYKSQVAGFAVDAGAEAVNDISGLRFDPEMGGLVARRGVPVFLMHIQGTPGTMQKDPRYENVVEEVLTSLRKSVGQALAAGVPEDRIAVDPGIGFGKTVRDNLVILKNLRAFKRLGRPVLIGVSRKSFIGKVLDLPEEERLEGSLAATAAAVLQGADIIRTHDVGATVRATRLIEAIQRA
jgi:dihydropteroate synthase